MPEKSYLSVGDVAVMLQVSTKWVYQHIRDIPGAFRFDHSKTWFIDPEVFKETLKQRAVAKPKVKTDVGASNRHGLS